MAKKKKKKKTSLITMALFIIAVGYILYDDGSSSSPFSKGGVQSASNMYDYRKIYQSWGTKETEQYSLAANVMTKNYYVILDTSGSMDSNECTNNNSKMNVAKASLSAWVNHVRPEDNIALMVFNDDYAKEIFPLRQNTENYKKQFLSEVSKVSAYGSTPLGDSLRKAYASLSTQASAQLGYGEYHVVVVTDGVATDDKVMDKAVQRIFGSPVVLHTIGFCIGNNHALNVKGKSFYISAMNQEQLNKGLENVLAESETFDVSVFSN